MANQDHGTMFFQASDAARIVSIVARRHRRLWLAIAAIAFAVGLAPLSADAASRPQKSYHQAFAGQCVVCHGERAPTVARTITCGNCHGTPADVAARTARLGDANPHQSPHYRNAVPCEECHKMHAPSTVYCAECHDWPQLKPK